MTRAEFLRVEEGLRHVIALEFGQKDNELVDDCIQDLRLFLRDRGVKIEPGVNPVDDVIFPVAIYELPTKPKNNILPKGSLKW